MTSPGTYRPRALAKHIWAEDVPFILAWDDEIDKNGFVYYDGHNNLLRRLVRFGYMENYRKNRYTWTDDGYRLRGLLEVCGRLEAAPKSEGAAP